VLIHPHTDSFDFIGLRSRSPADFVADFVGRFGAPRRR